MKKSRVRFIGIAILTILLVLFLFQFLTVKKIERYDVGYQIYFLNLSGKILNMKNMKGDIKSFFDRFWINDDEIGYYGESWFFSFKIE